LDGLDLLIVEDDPVNRDILIRFLEARGAAVRAARNGEEGLRSIEFRMPDAVLADLRMPKADGLEFLQTLRGNAPTRDLPVLVVTADLRSETRELLAQYSATALVPKPVDRTFLFDCLEAALPGRVARKSAAMDESLPRTLTRGALVAELGEAAAGRAIDSLAGRAAAAFKALSSALIMDEWNAFVAALEETFVEFGSGRSACTPAGRGPPSPLSTWRSWRRCGPNSTPFSGTSGFLGFPARRFDRFRQHSVPLDEDLRPVLKFGDDGRIADQPSRWMSAGASSS
jgi:CheY-like chemotaxis protein